MKLFHCHRCGQTLFFENWHCERCGTPLGYAPWRNDLLALDDNSPQGQSDRLCANSEQQACNWLLPADDAGTMCLACRHNRTIPDLTDATNLQKWREFEIAKRRLFYALIRFDLPIPTKDEAFDGLAFDFLADPDGPGPGRVLTGHDNGLITINILEADDAAREAMRQAMDEPYRTVLGHFRHEIGHFYWQQLVDAPGKHDAFREVFGDERIDYGQALQAHYEAPTPLNWQERFVSTYATAHPWEDFAETWAHYLHIVDTLETARAFRMSVDATPDAQGGMEADIDFDPYHAPSIELLIDNWLPLTFALNSLNRSMGHQDFYPFILSPVVIAKLGFVHRLIHT